MEIFKVKLENLKAMLGKVQAMGKATVKLNPPIKKFEKTLKSALTPLRAMASIFDKIYSIVKGLGLGSLFGLGGIGVRGIMALKASAESKRLGVQVQEKGALEYAGSQAGLGKDFFKGVLENIRQTSLTAEGLDLFGGIGLDALQISKMPALEALQATIQALQSTSLKTDAQTFERLLQGITGMGTYQFKAIDFSKFKSDFEEGLKYTDNSAEKIKTIGEGVNRLTANFQLLSDKILASLSPVISKVFTNIGVGLNAIATNKSFQELMEKIGNWATNISSKFDETLLKVVQDIPQLLRDFQIALLSITSTLINIAETFVFGKADDQLKRTRYRIDAYKEELEKRDAIEQKAKESLKQANPSTPQANGSSQALVSKDVANVNSTPINIQVNIQNDPLQAQTQKNFTQSISFGGSNG